MKIHNTTATRALLIIALLISCGTGMKFKDLSKGEVIYGMPIFIDQDSLDLYMNRIQIKTVQDVLKAVAQDSVLIGSFMNIFEGLNAEYYHFMLYRSLSEKDIQEYYCINDSSGLQAALADLSENLDLKADSTGIFNSPEFKTKYPEYLRCFRGMLDLFLHLADQNARTHGFKMISHADGLRPYFWISSQIQKPYYISHKRKVKRIYTGPYCRELLIDIIMPPGTFFDEGQPLKCLQRCIALKYFEDGETITIPFIYKGEYLCDIIFGI